MWDMCCICLCVCARKDFEGAVGAYRMAVGDYKSEKAIEQLAGALEMMGLCMALGKVGSVRDSLAAFESARQKYRSLGYCNVCLPPCFQMQQIYQRHRTVQFAE